MPRATSSSRGVVIGIGTLLSAVIDFLLVALIVFLMIKAFNKAKEKPKRKRMRNSPPPRNPLLSRARKCCYLREIRDSLKK